MEEATAPVVCFEILVRLDSAKFRECENSKFGLGKKCALIDT